MSEKIVQLNEEVIKGQIKKLARGDVDETLNGLLKFIFTGTGTVKFRIDAALYKV